MKPAKRNVFILIKKLKTIFDNKPDQEQMLKEVEMMRFKIRPVLGDISLLNFKNSRLVETLWSLGKLEEFFQNHFQKIPKSDRQIFFQVVGQFKEKLESQLKDVNLRQFVNTPQLIEMEIFKEQVKRQN
jgi:hypothetical protein